LVRQQERCLTAGKIDWLDDGLVICIEHNASDGLKQFVHGPADAIATPAILWFIK